MTARLMRDLPADLLTFCVGVNVQPEREEVPGPSRMTMRECRARIRTGCIPRPTAIRSSPRASAPFCGWPAVCPY